MQHAAKSQHEVAMRNPIQCNQCSMQSICVPAGLVSSDVELLDKSSREPHVYNKRAMVYSPDQPMHSLFAIKSGSVKCYTIDSEGKQQITSFHLAGDIIGMESIAKGAAITYCEALETSMLCEIKLSRLFAQNFNGVDKNLLQLLSKRIGQRNVHYLNVVNTTAEQRVASFLMAMGDHLHEHGFSRQEFRLPMTRTDIANYLGLAVETVSRIFTSFKNQGLIATQQSILTIKNLQELQKIAA
ncbi:helix-turn-helix domain-containing protein [Idiomarina sp.]|uniref:helix-turn-helix domain-containing protein n=1 Tax=Idiomarina sp. TaxID=1874361 RepID=UPI0025C3CA8F|nr:helix-turn-helix domain-containing protein [Idiomarina sp.]